MLLAIDEFSRFVTKDACEILDGGRKFKLHLLLAHQTLSQLREKDPEVDDSTLTNARTNIVFGGLNDEDTDVISRELFTGNSIPMKSKTRSGTAVLSRSKPPAPCEVLRHPRAVRAFRRYQSFIFRQWTRFHSGLGLLVDADSGKYEQVRSTGSSRSQAHQNSSSYGSTESTVPVYEFHEYRELTSRTFRSLKRAHLKKAQLKRQANQHATVLIPGQNVQLIKVATLREFLVTDVQWRIRQVDRDRRLL